MFLSKVADCDIFDRYYRFYRKTRNNDIFGHFFLDKSIFSDLKKIVTVQSLYQL